MQYRREIDGLRAIAIVPVILFHAGFQWFSGGFVGVDVFFVISGYLITSLIFHDLHQGTFSIINFYERRARRILPALFLVMLVSLPFAWFWMMPHQIKDFGESLTAVSLFSSNILFWLESGYFEQTSELKPLLHTWSLAVEEQYYVFFPLLLLLFRKSNARTLLTFFALFLIVSLALAEYGCLSQPNATFYLLPTRIWELLAGAITAIYLETYGRPITRPIVSELGGLIGLLLIIYSILQFDRMTPFPSLYTLIPVVGSVLIVIFAYPENTAGRVLSTKLFVGIGLVSYSAYLWHQPIFAFARVRSGNTELGSFIIAICVFLTFFAAYLSWKLIEGRFRAKKIVSRRMIFAFSVAGIAAFSVLGFAGHSSNGFIEEKLASIPSEKRKFLIQLDAERQGRDAIVARNASYLLRPNFDEHGPAAKILIIGDSVGRDLATTLSEYRHLFPESQFRFFQLDEHCMIPFSEAPVKRFVDEAHAPDSRSCDTRMGLFISSALMDEADLVVVTNLWKNDRDFTAIAGFLKDLSRRKKNVLALGSAGFLDIASISYKIASSDKNYTQEQLDKIVAESRRNEFDLGNGMLASVAREIGIKYQDRHDLYCSHNGLECRILYVTGESILWDNAHMTKFGMEVTAEKIAQLGWLRTLPSYTSRD